MQNYYNIVMLYNNMSIYRSSMRFTRTFHQYKKKNKEIKAVPGTVSWFLIMNMEYKEWKAIAPLLCVIAFILIYVFLFIL